MCLEIVVPVTQSGQIGESGLTPLAEGVDVVDLGALGRMAAGNHADRITLDERPS